jgi:large repetitive protein
MLLIIQTIYLHKNMKNLRSSKLAGLLIGTMLSMIVGVIPASAGGNSFTATITPSSSNTNQTKTYTIVVTNTDKNNTISSVSIDIPTGFVVSSASATASSTPASSWTVSTSTFPGILDVEADNSEYLNDADPSGNGGGVLTISFTAKAPNIAGTFTATTTAFNGYDLQTVGNGATFVISNSQPTIEVVVGVNHAPVVSNSAVTTSEDVATSSVLNVGTDSDGDSLIYSVVTSPLHGILSVFNATTRAFTYIPTLNYSGTDSFTFKANDGSADSNIATTSITINAVNDAPVATNVALSVDQNASVSGTLTATDVDSAVLTYSTSSNPTNGTISAFSTSTGSFTYTPNTNYVGTDSFTFKANDGSLNGNDATVTITVNAVNHAPTANASSTTTTEDTSVAIVLTGSDSDVPAQTVNYSVVTNPTQGTLSGTAPNLTYTPNTNYNGSDSFTFKANDGALDSAPATVTITVTSVNDNPVLAALSDASADELTPVTFTASASDVDGGTFTYSLSGTIPAGASINPSTGVFTWTPTEAQGPSVNTFNVVVSDGQGGTDSKSITLTVNEVNVAPISSDSSVSTHVNTAKTITLIGNDADTPVQTLVYAISTSPTNGTLGSISGNQVTYTPADGYTGTDTFTYTVTDGFLTSTPSTVTVTTGNDAPTLGEVTNKTVDEESLLSFTATATDPNEDTLTFSLSGTVPAGAAITSGGDFTWTPTEAQGPATYTFSVVVSDGTVSDSQAITITVNEVNAVPTAQDFTGEGQFTTQEDVAVLGTLAGSDVDLPSQAVTFAVASNPTNGTLSAFSTSSGAFTYVPNLNYNGTDSFTYVVNDGTVNSAVATATISISPVNDAPTITLLGSANTTVLVGTATSSVELGATASDVEDGDISEAILRTGTFNLSALGVYTLTYSVMDSSESSTSTTRTITVVAQPETPPTGGGAGGSNGTPGCRDPKATNYDPTAVYDGTCTYPTSVGQVLGTSTTTESVAPVQREASAVGQVLGAEASCKSSGLYISKFARQGYKNDTDTVKKLQSFLNLHMKATLPVTGFFGPMTTTSLKNFQSMHKDIILTPWNTVAPTGILYLTTITAINNIVCPEIAPAVASTELIPFSKHPQAPKK